MNEEGFSRFDVLFLIFDVPFAICGKGTTRQALAAHQKSNVKNQASEIRRIPLPPVGGDAEGGEPAPYTQCRGDLNHEAVPGFPETASLALSARSPKVQAKTYFLAVHSSIDFLFIRT